MTQTGPSTAAPRTRVMNDKQMNYRGCNITYQNRMKTCCWKCEIPPRPPILGFVFNIPTLPHPCPLVWLSSICSLWLEATWDDLMPLWSGLQQCGSSGGPVKAWWKRDESVMNVAGWAVRRPPLRYVASSGNAKGGPISFSVTGSGAGWSSAGLWLKAGAVMAQDPGAAHLAAELSCKIPHLGRWPQVPLKASSVISVINMIHLIPTWPWW